MLGVVAVIYITPFYWMIVSALKPQSEMFKFPPTLIPQTVTFDNFARVFDVIPLARAYWNTFYTTLYIVLAQLLFCSVAGYIFEKGRFRFRELCFTLILVTMIIPFQSEMVPLFLLMSDLGLVDTHAAIVLPAMITPFAVFFFRQNVKSIPDDLLDAARIDGSGVLGRYWHVVVPNIKPAIGTITIFAFLGRLEQLPVAADHSQLAQEDVDRAGALGADRRVRPGAGGAHGSGDHGGGADSVGVLLLAALLRARHRAHRAEVAPEACGARRSVSKRSRQGQGEAVFWHRPQEMPGPLPSCQRSSRQGPGARGGSMARTRRKRRPSSLYCRVLPCGPQGATMQPRPAPCGHTHTSWPESSTGLPG